MMLNSKQLEELENIHDTVAEFEEEPAANVESDSYDDGAESAMAWRRGMIEKAAGNVKKISRKHIDPKSSYSNGTLLFDRQAMRFGRVSSSSKGVLSLAYLTGGTNQLKQSQANMAMEVPAAKPSSTSKPVAKKAPPPTKKAPPPKKSTPAKPVKKTVVKKAPPAKKPVAKKTKPTLKTVTKTKSKTRSKSKSKKIVKSAPARKKTPVAKSKPVAKKNPVRKRVPAKSQKKPLKKRRASPVRMDPVSDPNGYIKQHFRLMSNKELASVTGLSEHTIRRKLGEWGLKRPMKA